MIQTLKRTYNLIFHREAVLSDEAAVRTGIRIENQNVDFSFSAKLLHCLVNAVLLFCCVFGTTAFLSSAFGIEYNEFLLMILFAGLACFISFMNYRQLTQNLGYFFLFIVFCFFVLTYRAYINSGFNAFLNDFYEFAAIKLDLDAVRTFTEQYEEIRYVTITLFYLTVGFVVMLLLNFTFNNEQNPFTVFILVFPFLQIGLYFDETPAPLSFVLLALAFLCCLIFRFNFQFIMAPQKRKTFRRHAKHLHAYAQFSSGKVMLQITAVMLAFLTAFSLIVSTLIPSENFNYRSSITPWKVKTEDTVKQFLMYGLRSFFPNANSSGGLDYGSLGQVGTVVPDFQTDLTVTFTPYVYDTIYLKSYIGVNYRGDRWETGTPQVLLFTEPYGSFHGYDEVINQEAEMLSALHSEDASVLKGKMRVEPNDPGLRECFYPYYSLFDPDSDAIYFINELTPALSPAYYNFAAAREQEYEYYVMQDVWNRVDLTQAVTTPYDKYVHDYYLTVWGGETYPGLVSSTYDATISSDATTSIPDTHDVTGQLAALCEEQGFGGNTYEIVSQVQRFLDENYTYSLNPGRTPADKDFVTYFLFEHPYGYCSYFATAATLLFRTMGIPARYVEGYALSMSNVLDAEILDEEKYEDWMEGEAAIGRTAVIQAEINDSQAHAWVEVYVNGFGWIPVEVTPAASDTNDDDTDYSNLWDRLIAGNNGEGNAALNTLLSNNLSDIGTFAGSLLLILLVGFLLLMLLRSVWKYYLIHKNRKLFYNGYSIPVLRQYQNLCALLQLLTLSDTDNLLPSSVKAILLAQEGTEYSQEDTENLITLYQTAAYSDETLSRERYQTWQQLYRKVSAPLLRRLSLRKRARYLLSLL